MCTRTIDLNQDKTFFLLYFFLSLLYYILNDIFVLFFSFMFLFFCDYVTL